VGVVLLQMHIGMRHLVPKLLEEHGLDATQLQIPLPIMRSLARGYTREAGVRSLTR
jgi:ATP-dependent Lon protease